MGHMDRAVLDGVELEYLALNQRTVTKRGQAHVHARCRSASTGVQTNDSRSLPTASRSSASIPSADRWSLDATAAATYPRQCVMLPTIPGGHSGSRRGPEGMGTSWIPSAASAKRAQARPARNSRRRFSTAVRMTTDSSGKTETSWGPF